jgi:AraC-like DNA-binding protein
MTISGSERTRAYVKVEDGCDSRCTYCIIRKARGGIRSRSIENSLAEVRALAAKGYREIVFCGIEISGFGKDTGESLADLIRVASLIDGIERIRLSSVDPAFLKPSFIDEVSEIKQFTPYFHLSIQSGSSSTLARMKRRYTSDMLREYDKKSHGYEDILLSYLKIIINKIERKLLTEKDEPPKQRRGQLLFDGVMAEVESAPAIDHKEKDFAERFYMSPAAFSAGFKRYSGISFASFLSSTRIKEAMRLLQEEDIPISAVQALSGYKDSKSFYRAFKRYTGTTPANYRNKH